MVVFAGTTLAKRSVDFMLDPAHPRMDDQGTLPAPCKRFGEDNVVQQDVRAPAGIKLVLELDGPAEPVRAVEQSVAEELAGE
jgi:hypothetical protein